MTAPDAPFDPGNRLVVALDVPTRRDALDLVQRIGGAASWVKVGLELFCAAGPDLVRELTGMNLRVMLDLKLHDIPKTVEGAVRQAARLGVGLLTVHAPGGSAMLEAAVKAAREDSAGPTRTRILAVTVLTSLDDADLKATGQAGSLLDLVLRRARLAAVAGCDGVVASALEAALVRATFPEPFLIVTPGIRTIGGDLESSTLAGDQKRIASPVAARRSGADLIVVGRPVREAEDPAAACRAIVRNLQLAGEASFAPID
ncbi:MAG: orotidine-5'-phosphate decarboxylase [Kofleriaceae bacterium]|nr:orotidine-5'-phosphate decarboxylase [Myxococcales bacterium]MCB9565282.1 orotidine-5'-phosphate decarboxylase [Kofleriaceae bacterium]